MTPFPLSASAHEMSRGHPRYLRALISRALDQKNMYGA
jgi:hypothetical protein